MPLNFEEYDSSLSGSVNDFSVQPKYQTTTDLVSVPKLHLLAMNLAWSKQPVLSSKFTAPSTLILLIFIGVELL